MFYKILAMAAIAPSTMLMGYSLLDSLESTLRSGDVCAVFFQDDSEDITKQKRIFYSVLETEGPYWLLDGQPTQKDHYYCMKFVPTSNPQSNRENIFYEVFYNNPDASLKAQWEMMKKTAEEEKSNIEVIRETHDSIEFRIYKSWTEVSPFDKSEHRLNFNSTGLITEFDNNIVWKFTYVNRESHMSKQECESMIKNFITIQSKLLNE